MNFWQSYGKYIEHTMKNAEQVTKPTRKRKKKTEKIASDSILEEEETKETETETETETEKESEE